MQKDIYKEKKIVFFFPIKKSTEYILILKKYKYMMQHLGLLMINML